MEPQMDQKQPIMPKKTSNRPVKARPDQMIAIAALVPVETRNRLIDEARANERTLTRHLRWIIARHFEAQS